MRTHASRLLVVASIVFTLLHCQGQAIAEQSLATGESQLSTEALVESVAPSVCRIKVYDEHGVCFGQGTGFLVGPNRIATCCHVLAGAARASAVFGESSPIDITQVVSQDKQRDLAVAAIENSPQGVSPLALIGLEVPKQGSSVIAVGYPLSLALTVSKGIITALPTGADLNRSAGAPVLRESDRLIQTDAAISPGNSGGPLVDVQGKVVAVMALVRRGGENLGFGIPCAYLRTLLTAGESPQPLSSVTAHEIAWDFGSPILPPRSLKVSLDEITRHVGRLIRITSCRTCRGAGTVRKRVLDRQGGLGRSGSSHYTNERCPDCRGRGYIRTNDLLAYDILAEMSEPLVYLDTQATVVRPSQASDIVQAIMRVVDRVSKTEIPMEMVRKAEKIIRESKEGEAHGVCFAARIMKKITSANRDYLLAEVVGTQGLLVVIVTNAGQYRFDAKDRTQSDFEPQGSYLVSGLAVGCLEGSSGAAFHAFVWPALITRPGVVYYTTDVYGHYIPVSYEPRTFFIPIGSLHTAAEEDKTPRREFITLD